MKFLALNVDFNDPSLDLLGSRKPAQKGIKKLYPLKVVILLLLASLLCLSQQALLTSFLVASTSMTLKDPEIQK